MSLLRFIYTWAKYLVPFFIAALTLFLILVSTRKWGRKLKFMSFYFKKFDGSPKEFLGVIGIIFALSLGFVYYDINAKYYPGVDGSGIDNSWPVDAVNGLKERCIKYYVSKNIEDTATIRRYCECFAQTVSSNLTYEDLLHTPELSQQKQLEIWEIYGNQCKDSLSILSGEYP